jgi:hypothetical protein
MAKIGNETKLILNLAEERVKNSKKLAEETECRGRPGNYPENLDWKTAFAIGYRIGVQEYKNTLLLVVRSLEER